MIVSVRMGQSATLQVENVTVHLVGEVYSVIPPALLVGLGRSVNRSVDVGTGAPAIILQVNRVCAPPPPSYN